MARGDIKFAVLIAAVSLIAIFNFFKQQKENKPEPPPDYAAGFRELALSPAGAPVSFGSQPFPIKTIIMEENHQLYEVFLKDGKLKTRKVK